MHFCCWKRWLQRSTSTSDARWRRLPSRSIDPERCSSPAQPRLLKVQRRGRRSMSSSVAAARVAPVESLPRGLSGSLLLHEVTCCGGCWGGNFYNFIFFYHCHFLFCHCELTKAITAALQSHNAIILNKTHNWIEKKSSNINIIYTQPKGVSFFLLFLSSVVVGAIVDV